MIDITQIAQAVFALLAALVTAYVVPFIKNKLTSAQHEALAAWVSAAVSAAEQIYSGNGKGSDKKEYVIGFLAGRGITIDATALDMMIEAAVFELKKGV